MLTEWLKFLWDLQKYCNRSKFQFIIQMELNKTAYENCQIKAENIFWVISMENNKAYGNFNFLS